MAIDFIPGEAFQYLIYVLRAGCIFIFATIVFCHILFAIGWAKGWKDPNLTPEEILNRLFNRQCDHVWDMRGSNQASHYVKCTKCGKAKQ